MYLLIQLCLLFYPTCHFHSILTSFFVAKNVQPFKSKVMFMPVEIPDTCGSVVCIPISFFKKNQSLVRKQIKNKVSSLVFWRTMAAVTFSLSSVGI